MYKFIFSNKITTRILRHACFWLCWYLYSVFIFLYNNNNVQSDFWQNLALRSLKLLRVFPGAIATCYIVIYCLVPTFLYKKKYFLFIAGFVIIEAIEIFFVDIVSYKSFDFLPVWIGITSAMSRGGPFVCLVFFIIKTLKTWYIQEWEKDALLKENLNAELQLLSAQVHPHFLFNTLNNIYSFILSNPVQAQDLVQRLDKLLRYMINECEAPSVHLQKEIIMLNDYIELEKVRYGARLTIGVNIEGNYRNKIITPLLMIPFVENSFKHGASKMLRNPWIKLFIQADENILHFSLTNSKPVNADQNQNGRIGLNNVKKRLELLYPQNHLLLIESTANTFTVNMQVPLQKIGEEVLT
ncbi:MAG TPA: histidine kinase [Parafilimonas sp.]|nr:histidine kinase [Parafilimonas sp.]